MARLFTRRAAATLAALALITSTFLALGAAPTGGASTAAANAAAWLTTQQQADGGFEVAGYPGFETADAIFALAAASQTSSSWSTAQARAAVFGTSTSAGKTPLDAIDASSSGIGPGQAGKVIALVTNPTGLDPSAFDPTADGAIDLTAILGEPGADNKWGIGLGAFNSILYAIRGYAMVHGTVPSTTIDVVRAAQKSDGSWSFDGDSTGTDGGADTTGLAVQALVDAGYTATDPDVDAALDYLEAEQLPTGGWDDGFTENPNSTALAMLGLAAGGRTAPLAAGDAYLLGLQQPDGRIASPYDSVPPNTFATSQGIEALVRINVPKATSLVTPVTVPAASGGGAVTVETSAGTLEGVVAVDPATLPAPPDGATFPRGLISFRVTGLAPGGSATVRIVLPIGTTVDRYYKSIGGAWVDVTAAAVFEGNTVTLTLVDGGADDSDGTPDGVITDPGGAALAGVPTAAPTDPTDPAGPTVEPADPTDPTDPGAPVDSAAPTAPVEPAPVAPTSEAVAPMFTG